MILIVDMNDRAQCTPKFLPRLLPVIKKYEHNYEVRRDYSKIFKDINKYRAVIISGSNLSCVYPTKQQVKDLSNLLLAFSQAKLPILGICYGLQILNVIFGGTVKKLPKLRIGNYTITSLKSRDDCLFKNMPQKFKVKLYHYDVIDKLSDFFIVTSRDSSGNVMSIANSENLIYATQFHAEDCPNTHCIIGNFLTLCANAN